MKAIGLGLSMPLDQFAVNVSPAQKPRLLDVTGRPEDVERWTFQDLQPAPGYQGAIAVEGSGWTLHRFRLEDEEAE